MRLWSAQVVSGVPQPLVEHDELRWLEHGRWLDVDWLDPDVPIVEAFARAAGVRPAR
jgi:8-oxo-dGTP diphosphatase